MQVFERTLAVAAALLTLSGVAMADEYGPGITNTEIKIGNINPYSGPVSAFAANGMVAIAYFNMINAQGGINGRKINMISLDDGYSPPRTVEQTRKLVEDDGVFAMFGLNGTPGNLAVQKYLNAKKIPQILSLSGSSALLNPKQYPWTTSLYPTFDVEGRILARYVLQVKPDAKIAVIYQHDNFGEEFLKGFEKGLGAKAKTMIVKTASYELSDPMVDSQVTELQGSGADTLFTAATPKFAAQAIRKVHDLGWKPLHLLISEASSIGATLTPAGLSNAVGIVTAAAFKTPLDPTWDKDEGMQEFIAFMKKWNPQGKIDDISAETGYITSVMMGRILSECGNNLTRSNLLEHATNIPPTSLPVLLPGVTISMTPTDYEAFKTLRMVRFDGERWVMIGDPVSVK